jgi:hypothetical protein
MFCMANDPIIEGPTPADIDKLRAECRQSWTDMAEKNSLWSPLRGGPADGEYAPRHGPTFSGSWVTDRGDVVLLTYEWVQDGTGEPDSPIDCYGEFAGMSNTRLLADETMDAEFEKIRAEAEAEPEPVDLETMTTEEALAFLTEDNARRVTELYELSDGQVELDNAFDLAHVKIFVNRILLFMSVKIHTEAQLEYEDHRSRKLDEIEDKFNKFQDERERALAQARLQVSQGPPPGMAPPGMQERINLPPRRIRRGG